MMRENNHKTHSFLHHTLEESKQKIISNRKKAKCVCFFNSLPDVSDAPTK